MSSEHGARPTRRPKTVVRNRLDQIIGRRRRLGRDERLYQMDQPFRNLCAVRFGHFKTYQVNAAGEQQITGFQMAAELLGCATSTAS